MAIEDGGLLLGAALSTGGGGQTGTSTSRDGVDGSLGQISAVSNSVHTSAVLYSVEEGQVGTDAYSVELGARDAVEDGQVGTEAYSVELGARDAVVNAVDVGVGVLAVTYVVPSEVDKNTSEPEPTDGWHSVALPASENVLAVSLQLEERGVRLDRSEDGQTS